MAVLEELIKERQQLETPKIIDADKQLEYVNGSPEVKEMAGAKHGGVGGRLYRRIGNFVEENNLGEVYGPDTTFLIGENERLPDISFVSIERIPPEGEPTGAWSFAPDLAIEVISPNDVFQKVLVKVNDYFNAGVQQIWLVLPEDKRLMIFKSPSQIKVLTENEELVCEDILQGFRCPLKMIFRNPAEQNS